MIRIVLLNVGLFISFLLSAQLPNSVLISELMVDPTPQVALPNAEWMEITNTNSFSVQLKGYKLQKAGGATSGAMPDFVLEPNGRVIVCTASQVANLSSFGATIAVTSFPSLTNGGDIISLLDAGGTVLHTVAYSDDWYANVIKADGGWSLEMIDLLNPCQRGQNWRASTDIRGGTPGTINSVNAPNPDTITPGLVSATATNSQTIVVEFTEPVTLATAEMAANYSLTGITIQEAILQTPLNTQVMLTLSTPLAAQTVYTLTVQGIADCAGNKITSTSAKTGIAALADKSDIAINEVLFNPPTAGSDYVELYNASSKILNLRQLYLTNRTSTGALGTPIPISTTDRTFFPGEYLAITESAAWLNATYSLVNANAVIEMGSMPSFPDDKGTVVVLSAIGEVVDEISYTEAWHFALLSNPEGVALERIDFAEASNKASNWNSAAATVNFGTPTRQNSQFKKVQETGSLTITPKIFSPDNDGFDDFAQIQLKVTEPGFVANITLFDANGRPVRVLQRNASVSLSNLFKWDGLGENNKKLPLGIYIVYAEVFNLQGKKTAYKETISLARKF